MDVYFSVMKEHQYVKSQFDQRLTISFPIFTCESKCSFSAVTPNGLNI